MRFFGIVGVLAAGLCVAACGDGEGSAIVGDEISWRLGCASATGCGTHVSHTQANVEQNFKVSCSRTSAGLSIRIEDPGFRGDPTAGIAGAMRPGGSIEIRNGNPQINACNVTVKDADEFGGFPISYVGQCGTVCTFTGQYNYNDWDFSGELICNGLTASGATGTLTQTRFTLVDAVTGGAVKISVDNCG